MLSKISARKPIRHTIKKLFGLDGAEYDVMIFNVKKAIKDDGSAVSRYFVVIHDGSVVVKTMLVEEID